VNAGYFKQHGVNVGSRVMLADLLSTLRGRVGFVEERNWSATALLHLDGGHYHGH
jgi:hypothetical protein